MWLHRCPGRWVGGNTWTRQRNWFNYFCDPLPGAAVSKKLVAQCDARKTRCFTSYDSNWSNNPFLINRQYIFNGEKVREVVVPSWWVLLCSRARCLGVFREAISRR